MKDGVGKKMSVVARKKVFDEYLDYYNQTWPTGNLKLCKETPVTLKAERFLLSEIDPGERFTTFDFYQTSSECVKLGIKDCRSFFIALIKATEVLEMICVNLYLYPWKKEIKIIKVKKKRNYHVMSIMTIISLIVCYLYFSIYKCK